MRVRLLACVVLLGGAGAGVGQEPVTLPPLSAPHESVGRVIDQGLAARPAPTLPRCWAEVDYVLYWLKPVCYTVPGITVGDPNDPQPGVLGQPGTVLVQGDHKFEFKGANGLRARVGGWFSDDQLLGFEVEGFVLEHVAAPQPVVTDAAGRPPTFLAFQNPDNSQAALPFSVPGVVAAGSSAVGGSQMWGLDGGLPVHIGVNRGPWALHATALFGWRYLHLADRVVITNRQSLVADPTVTAFGEAKFATRNQFIGGQLGSRFGVSRGPFTLELTTKLALGETFLVSEVSGSPLVSGASVLPPLVPGPLLALPSNVGRLESARITVVSEVNVRVRWQVCDRCYLTLGYNALHWNKILCPGDQMSSLVNTTQLPGRGPVVGPADPPRKFVFTDTYRAGVEAGFGLTF